MLRFAILFLVLTLTVNCTSSETPTPDPDAGSSGGNGGSGSGNDGGNGSGGNNGDPEELSIGLFYSLNNGQYSIQTVTADGTLSGLTNLNESIGFPNDMMRLIHTENNILTFQAASQTQYHYSYNFKSSQLEKFENNCGIDELNALPADYDDSIIYKAFNQLQDPLQRDLFREDSSGNCEILSNIDPQVVGSVRELFSGDDYVFLDAGLRNPLSNGIVIYNKGDGSFFKRMDNLQGSFFVVKDNLYRVYFDDDTNSYKVEKRVAPDFEVAATATFGRDWWGQGPMQLYKRSDQLVTNDRVIVPFKNDTSDPNFILNPAIYNMQSGTFVSRTDLAETYFAQLRDLYDLQGMAITHYTGDISDNLLTFTFADFNTSKFGIVIGNFQGEITASSLLIGTPAYIVIVK